MVVLWGSSVFAVTLKLTVVTFNYYIIIYLPYGYNFMIPLVMWKYHFPENVLERTKNKTVYEKWKMKCLHNKNCLSNEKESAYITKTNKHVWAGLYER